jgi:HKD family nuclease
MKVTHVDAQEAGWVLERLMKKYDRFHWAVAWATETSLSRALLDNAGKIDQLVIGTDFGHTSPKLLRALMPIKAAHVATTPSGVTFHPKVYGFVSGDLAAVMVGSSNFTRGGTHSNEEACLLLEGDLQEQPLMELLAAVERWWLDGERIKPAFLEAYERRCAATKRYREALARKVFVPKPKPGAKQPRLLSLDWSEYVHALGAHGDDNLERRLAVLHKAGELFAAADTFASMGGAERKALSGYIEAKERDATPGLGRLDWGWFGSMRGAGVFKNRVNENDRQLSAALDCIPSSGEVTSADFDRFAAKFQRAFKGSARTGRIAPASRLLAMKRPDCFVCVDSANVRGLAGSLGFAPTTVDFANYWTRVIDPLMTARWWQEPRPTGSEGRIWDGRAAMVDAIYYVPK